MKQVTQSELTNILAQRKGAIACQVLSRTKVKARKNPFGDIYKQAAASVLVGKDYEAGVNRQAAKEGSEQAGEFQAESIWQGKGVHLVPNKVIQHTGKGTLYLYCQASDKQLDAFPPSVEYYNANGERLTYEQVAPYLPERKESAKQTEHGVTNQQNVRMIALDNVQAVCFDGEQYVPSPD